MITQPVAMIGNIDNDGFLGETCFVQRDQNTTDIVVDECRLDDEVVSPEMASAAPTPMEIGEMAKRAGVRSLILSHFRKHMDDPRHHNSAIKKGSEAFGKTISIAEDLKQIKI